MPWLALYGDNVYLATHDAALVALDARTGTEVWRTMKADYTQGFMQFGGPVIANGVVVSGINGGQRYKEQTCFITGHGIRDAGPRWRGSPPRPCRVGSLSDREPARAPVASGTRGARHALPSPKSGSSGPSMARSSSSCGARGATGPRICSSTRV
ncbi:MAG: hypothetical protein VYE68_15505 [Acidobacteriota bacterium]|nr:hypothetical protein [Acidobacteriota bacterium]